MAHPPTPTAVLFDLDDTLYPQQEFLDGAWDAVADAGRRLGLDAGRLRRALAIVAAEGSDRGLILDRALALVDGPSEAVPALVAAFGAHRPTALRPYPGVADAVGRLHRRVRLALITDGRPDQQRAKLEATGLADLFEVVVVTDELGREHRKPDRRGFDAVLDELGVEPEDVVMIGDRVDKDVEGAQRVRIEVIRVRQGEHRGADTPAGVPEVADTPAAVALVEHRLAGIGVDPSDRPLVRSPAVP